MEPTVAASKQSHLASYGDWSKHNLGDCNNTQFAVHDFLRNKFADHNVTRIMVSACDLLGYASAGFASAIPRHNTGIDALRNYISPPNRLNHLDDGKLADTVKFGRWAYNWKSRDYILYRVQYPSRWDQPVELYYILSQIYPDSTTDGHHIDTDNLLLAAGKWTTELHNAIYVFDQSEWHKDTKLYADVQSSFWDDVILSPGTKSHLIHDVQSFFDNRPLYQSLHIPWKRGVIFHGVPGNGKTISLKALINSLSKRDDPIPSLYVKNLDHCASPKYSINEIFSHARRMAPCLLIFEDLDSLIGDDCRSYFLNQVDGIESNEGILMVGSTNHLDKLDSAIAKRPSRFDRKYHFKVPGLEERQAYARYWREKVRKNGTGMVEFPDEVCDVVASLTEGFSFAYLKELFVASLLELAKDVTGGHGKEETSSVEDGVTSSSDISARDSVMVARPEDGGKTEGDDQADKIAVFPSAARQKKELPDVQVPANVKDNALMKTIKKQARMLFDQMGNTDDENADEEQSKRMKPKPITMMRARAGRAC
jgi:hypothetical protein